MDSVEWSLVWARLLKPRQNNVALSRMEAWGINHERLQFKSPQMHSDI